MMTVDAPKRFWEDADLIRTNPVFVADHLLAELEPWFQFDRLQAAARFGRCLEELAQRGGRVPDAVLTRFRNARRVPEAFSLSAPDERPGVLGLAVDPTTGHAFVLPLRPERLGFSATWDVPRTLPFPEEDVQDLLVAWLHAGVPDARGVPERLAYRFTNPLKRKVRGNSMTVAAALAVLDELSGRATPRLRAAIALVEPGADGSLEEVEKIPEKLAAAFREHDRLSLVVVREGSTALAQLDRERVECVWEVRTVADLARELEGAGLLGPLFESGTAPLGAVELSRIQNRLHSLIDNQHRYAEAANLADRTRQCPRRAPIDPGTLTEIGRLSAAACRHHGRFSDAVALGREVYDQVRALGPGASDDEEADAAAEFAAALYDSHAFGEIPALLEPWARQEVEHPRRFRVLTRLKVRNTLARARVILGEPGWTELFQRSLELTRSLNDVGNVQRTLSYLVHGLLRHGSADRAIAALDSAGTRRTPLPSPNPWVGFALANAARVEGTVWEHPDLDSARPGDERAAPKHAYGFYFQATGRQEARPAAGELGRIERFARSAAFFRAEAGTVPRNICVLFAHTLDLAAAGLIPSAEQWAASSRAIREFLDHPNAASLRAYYTRAVDALPTEPDARAAEQLLRLVPYF
jgi:hypothetical protein